MDRCLAAYLLLAVLLTPTAKLCGSPPAQGAAGDEEQLITNSIAMKLRRIPAGGFFMGSPPAEIKEMVTQFRLRFSKTWGWDEQPVHNVQITKPFYLGQHEVTVGQFRAFVEATGYRTEAEGDGEGGNDWRTLIEKVNGRDPTYTWKHTGFPQTDNHPVVNVTWNDAVAFCEWLSRKEGKSYRLPTEAEWEYACRSGAMTPWHHGDNSAGLAQVANVLDATAKAVLKKYDWLIFLSVHDGHIFTAPVGAYRPNAFGLYDMHGNVCEWCADWYGRRYYQKSPVGDPGGPLEGWFRVDRGGSWFHCPPLCRSASRRWNYPSHRSCNLGFRVALVPSSDADREQNQ